MNFWLDIGFTALTLVGCKRYFCINKDITRVFKWCVLNELWKCRFRLCFDEGAVSEVALSYKRFRWYYRALEKWAENDAGHQDLMLIGIPNYSTIPSTLNVLWAVLVFLISKPLSPSLSWCMWGSFLFGVFFPLILTYVSSFMVFHTECCYSKGEWGEFDAWWYWPKQFRQVGLLLLILNWSLSRPFCKQFLW